MKCMTKSGGNFIMCRENVIVKEVLRDFEFPCQKMKASSSVVVCCLGRGEIPRD